MRNPDRSKESAHQKILIVDDKEANLFALSKLLKETHADIVQALDGQTALAQVLDHDFALIILDVRMPGMDGYEVAEHLQGDRLTKNIPIIFVTAEYPDEEHICKGYESGAVDYMLKPYSPRILLSKVNILLEMDRTRKELQQHHDSLEETVLLRTEQLSVASRELLQFSWLLEKENNDTSVDIPSKYGDLTELNQNGLILSSVGKETLSSISNDVMDLLDTCLVVFEKNGDYAFGKFISSWCGMLDNASRKCCNSKDNREALPNEKWLCHDHSWGISKAAMNEGKAVDRECVGGLNIYAVPIHSADKIIGVINVGYGTPPKDAALLTKLAEQSGLDMEDLRRSSEAYKPRPHFIIEVAKRRLHSIARLIGEIVERKQIEQQLQSHNEELTLFNRMAVGRELRMVDLKKEVNALCLELGRETPYRM